MWKKLAFCFTLCTAFVLFGCGAKQETIGEKAGTPEKPEPDRVTVQHILIAFEGSVTGKAVTRSKEEAERLADEIFRRAKNDEDFAALVKEYTDDVYPGIYGIVNHGGEANPDMQIYARESMVPAFGDVAFSLAEGGIGLAPYDKDKSKYGWHIIKRLR